MNCLSDRSVEEVVMVSSRQVGKTTILENMIGYTIRQDPGPVRLVLPTQELADRQLERLKDMIDSSPRIAREKTPFKKDWRKDCIQTERMILNMGWAGGVNTLKASSSRFLFGDETEAWEMHKEGHPWDILEPASNSFHNRKHFLMTTPLTSDGFTWQRYLKSDKRKFWVPCPRCEQYQELYFSDKTLRWPKNERDPQVIYAKNLAMYHCDHCEKTVPHELKQGMLLKGLWVPHGCEIWKGQVKGEPPATTLRGYNFGALISPFVNWSKMAAKFLDLSSKGLINSFRNLWEGLPYENKALEVAEDRMHKLEKPYELHGAIPNEVQRVVSGADLQWKGDVDHVYFVVRGYGANGQSWLLDEGRIDADDQASDLYLFMDYLEQRDWRREDGTRLYCEKVLIDAGDGNRTYEVYDLSQINPLVLPIQGKRGGLNVPVMVTSVEKFQGMKFSGAIERASVDTDHFKSQIAGKINRGTGHWMPMDASQLYKKSLVSEHRIKEKSKTGQYKYFWRLKAGVSENHLWDAEVYCAAAAWYCNLNRLIDPSEARQRPAHAPQSEDSWLSGGRGGVSNWIAGRRGRR